MDLLDAVAIRLAGLVLTLALVLLLDLSVRLFRRRPVELRQRRLLQIDQLQVTLKPSRAEWAGCTATGRGCGCGGAAGRRHLIAAPTSRSARGAELPRVPAPYP